MSEFLAAYGLFLAELATFALVLVILILVIVASRAPLDVEAVLSSGGRRGLGWSALSGAELDRWIGDAPVLTDDHAPVDQLLTPYSRESA